MRVRNREPNYRSKEFLAAGLWIRSWAIAWKVEEFDRSTPERDITTYILCSMKTVISVKVDVETKEAAQEVARSAGLTLSALVNSYLRQIVATRRIELYVPEPMTPHLEELIAEVELELHAGKASRPFQDIEEFLLDLKQ